jgi:hypothetical protein
MKKIQLLFVVIMMATMSACGPDIYQAPNFAAVRKTQKVLAIIPFKVSLDMKKLPKGATVESIRESNKETGYSLQSNAYSALLKELGRDKYDIDFQDVDKTNSILAKNNISYEDLVKKDKGELCTLLGVDGIISGDARMTKPMSEGAAVVVGLLVGGWGATNKTDVSLTIHDKKESKLMWKYDYEASGSVGSSPESLAKALMRNVSKKFPYKKK